MFADGVRLVLQNLLQLISRIFLKVYLGVNIRMDEYWSEDNWPPKGSAVYLPTHNSNFDTNLVEYLFPFFMVRKIRPVAARDYWASRKILDLFARHVARVIYVERGSGKSGVDPYALVHEAIARGESIIVYPEGTRGEPETLAEIKKGISHLMLRHPKIPFVPIHIYGAGKAQGQVNRWWKVIPLPFIVDVNVGRPIFPKEVLRELGESKVEPAIARKIEQEYLHDELCLRMIRMDQAHNRGAWT
jgi:1-acyl-sn-glycerol-3-phosphate acyltransferase